MLKDMIQAIHQLDVDILLVDIDGTLKNLCVEHTRALRSTLKKCIKYRAIEKVILKLNEFAMSFVKMGILPTNVTSQNILLFVYSVLSGTSYTKFKQTYYSLYKEELCLFYDLYKPLKELFNEKKVLFVTVNKQNYNLSGLGIDKERIFCTSETFKVKTYKRVLKELNCPKEKVVIVGDNLFDDLLSARLIGVKSLLVNNYNSKLKSIIARMFKIST